ncbi:hypothetical protein K505DRAFT_219602, partial [Melanomma pulvis-pyrius CBS 109.77]
MIERIQSAVDYSRTQDAAGQPPYQTAQFTLPVGHPGLEILREAHANGIAFQINASPTEECYELGVPAPVTVTQVGIDPQWWIGKSRAELRAGPFASKADVKRA